MDQDDLEETPDTSNQGSGNPGEAFAEEPPEDEIQEIEEERERRLDPDHRPEGSEVDNTGENMPDFLKDEPPAEGAEGSSDPSKAFRENPPSEEEVKEIEAERERRLAPENRPEGAEVDNTGENMPDFVKDELEN